MSAATHNAWLYAVIAISPEKFAYLSGFVVPSQPLIRHCHAAAIGTASGGTAVFGVDMETSTIRQGLPDLPSAIWAEFSDDAITVLAGQLKGLGGRRIVIEMDYLPAGDFLRLTASLPKVRFEPVEGLLARLRKIKTPSEIALLRRLSRIADQAITDALASAKAG